MDERLRAISLIAEKYDLQDVLECVSSTSKSIKLRIGVLGDFSSGKSTLLNALIGKEILPVQINPTTKSITQIEVSQSTDDIFEYRVGKYGNIENSYLAEFEEIAKGTKDGVAYVTVPSNKFLDHRFVFIDTPGLESLDLEDSELTKSFLPNLDIVMICIDSNGSGISESLKSFLADERLRELMKNALFVLTKMEYQGKIRDKASGIKKSLNEELGYWGDIDRHVVAVSAMNQLNSTGESGFEDMIKMLNEIVIPVEQELIRKRHDIEVTDCARLLLQQLKNIENSHQYDDNELRENIEKITKDKQDFIVKKQNLLDALRNSKSELRKILDAITKKYEFKITSDVITDNEGLSSLFENLQTELENAVKAVLNPIFDDFKDTISEYGFFDTSLIDHLREVLIGIQVTLKVAVAIGVAALIPGGEFGGNALQFIVTMLFQNAIDKENVRLKTTDKEDKELSHDDLKKKEEKSGKIIDMINKVNPADKISRIATQIYGKAKIKKLLSNIPESVSEQICNGIEIHLSTKVFPEIDKKIEMKRDEFENIRRIYSRVINDKSEFINNLREDIKRTTDFAN